MGLDQYQSALPVFANECHGWKPLFAGCMHHHRQPSMQILDHNRKNHDG